MKKPSALVRLIEELQEEEIQTNVGTSGDSKAVIYLNAEDANGEDGITLTIDECRLVFHNADHVEQLHEALDSPEEAYIELHDVRVPDSVADALERLFAAVDVF